MAGGVAEAVASAALAAWLAGAWASAVTGFCCCPGRGALAACACC